MQLCLPLEVNQQKKTDKPCQGCDRPCGRPVLRHFNREIDPAIHCPPLERQRRQATIDRELQEASASPAPP